MLESTLNLLPPVLSHFQANQVLQARKKAETRCEVSVDLERSTTTLMLSEAGATIEDGTLLPWDALTEIAENTNGCYLFTGDGLRKIQVFSDEFNRHYSLYPTQGPPTLLISGIPMHRIKGTDPARDTAQKLRAAGRMRGAVLDTATGLGYTAIAAARNAERVVTIELDPAVLDICRLNPWSQELFTNPVIEQCIGDSADVVETLADQSFGTIIHDPPMFSLAGHLYGRQFYEQLYRTLQQSGRLYHYIGSPETKSGRNITKGVVQRLQDAGFSDVRPAPRAFGVTARRRARR